MTFRSSNSDPRCQYRPHLPDHHRLFLLRLLHSYTHEVRPSFYHLPTPTFKVRPPHRLAISLHHDSLPLPLLQLQPRQPCIPNPFLSHTTTRVLILAKRRRCRQCGLPGSRHLSRLLDVELPRYGCSRTCLRECRHVHRPALDSTLAYLLGHHECCYRVLLA